MKHNRVIDLFQHLNFPEKICITVLESEYDELSIEQVKREHCTILMNRFSDAIKKSYAHYVNFSSIQLDTPLNRKKLSNILKNKELLLEKSIFYSFGGKLVLISVFKLEKEKELLNIFLQLYSGYYSKSFIMIRDEITDVSFENFILLNENRHGRTDEFKIQIKDSDFDKDLNTEFLFTFGGFDFGSFICLILGAPVR